jgi:hypothetical protein
MGNEPSLHCKQSSRFYLLFYAEDGRNKIRSSTEKQNSPKKLRIGERTRKEDSDLTEVFFPGQ